MQRADLLDRCTSRFPLIVRVTRSMNHVSHLSGAFLRVFLFLVIKQRQVSIRRHEFRFLISCSLGFQRGLRFDGGKGCSAARSKRLVSLVVARSFCNRSNQIFQRPELWLILQRHGSTYLLPRPHPLPLPPSPHSQHLDSYLAALQKFRRCCWSEAQREIDRRVSA